MKISIFKVLIGGLGSTVALLIGGWDTWAKSLMLLMVVDYVTGWMAGYVTQSMSSKIAGKGIAKKIAIIALVIVAAVADRVTGQDLWRLAIIGFYTWREAFSIIENAGKMGLPIPVKLKNAMAQLEGRVHE